MFWRIITHVCGHQERISADGPYVVVEQRIRKAEQSMCDSCAGHVNRWDNELKGFCDLWGVRRTPQTGAASRRRRMVDRTQGRRHRHAGAEHRTLGRGNHGRAAGETGINHSPTRPDWPALSGTDHFKRCDFKLSDRTCMLRNAELGPRKQHMMRAGHERCDGELRNLRIPGRDESIFD
ncbi:hypothetical protein [Bifidobacterium saguinibicoloris]|uniref:hypothetical protein n=1 Tax=Bifidobacterium saguinibicoloris TaxID=2834433 RepID=UPI001C592E31|nr:hypothetical protein [Bifidobacterium saguinibicoloris]MBW3080021.1 hypothetical protein [Bifidobacterium saguinibicoloris]